MQNGLSAFNHQCMPGIVPTLKAGDDIRLACIKIDNFSFSFVTPLSAYNCNIAHEYILSTF